jgi:hypothetical protein
MQLIPITKAYRAGYEGIRWDVDDWGVVKAVKEGPITSPKVLRPDDLITSSDTGWWLRMDKIPGMPASRYQGC